MFSIHDYIANRLLNMEYEYKVYSSNSSSRKHCTLMFSYNIIHKRTCILFITIQDDHINFHCPLFYRDKNMIYNYDINNPEFDINKFINDIYKEINYKLLYIISRINRSL